jgi:PAS domain S-box-containing protein
MEKTVREADLYELLQGTGDAAFVVDTAGSICFWSPAAQESLGIAASAAKACDCATLLQGCDAAGKRVCATDCVVQELAADGQPVKAFDLHARTADGARKWFNVSILVARAQGRTLLVHLLRDIEERRRLESMARDITNCVAQFLDEAGTGRTQAPRSPAVALTVRERKVLELLVLGRSTAEIGSSLQVQPATVRNHVQHILHKLRVHTRLEAVIRAGRERLI